MAFFSNIRTRLRRYDKQVTQTIGVYIDAHQFVRKHRLGKYLLISGIAFLLLFSFTIESILYLIDYLKTPITEFTIPYIMDFLAFSKLEITQGINTIFWLVKFAVESNKDAIFSGIFLVIGTPFFSYISSKTEELDTGRIYQFKWRVFLKEIRRGISLSIRNSFKQVLWIILFSACGMIPVVGIISPLLVFATQAYYNGILMTDYTLERHGLSVKESQQFYLSKKAEMFSIGLGFMFLLLIPVAGWFIAPVYGLVASYLYFSGIRDQVKSTEE